MQESQSSSSPFPVTANPTTSRPNQGPSNQTWRLNQPSGSFFPKYHNTGSQSSAPPNDRPPSRLYLCYCQACNTQSHTVKRCPNFHLTINTPSTQNQRPSTSWTPRPEAPWLPRAHFTATTPAESPAWLMDSGASHHIITDLSNLSLHTPYDGFYDVVMMARVSNHRHWFHLYVNTLSHPFNK